MTKEGTKEKKEAEKTSFWKRLSLRGFLLGVANFMDRKLASRRLMRFAFCGILIWLLFDIVYRYLWPILFYMQKKYGLDL